MTDIIGLFADPGIWLALVTLIVLEVVLGVDNLVFVAILSGKLPPEQQQRARRIGLGLALAMRLALLGAIAWIVSLTAPLADFGLTGPPGEHGEPTFETALSGRDLILIAGGLFLLWKATTEIGESLEGEPAHHVRTASRAASFGNVLIQIVLLDIVFSLDSVLTAVGMANEVAVMIAAVVIAVGVMLIASGPLAAFVHAHPTVKMLALAFLLLIGVTLIADGFGFHIDKAYIYAAMGFSVFVEALNLRARSRRRLHEEPVELRPTFVKEELEPDPS